MGRHCAPRISCPDFPTAGREHSAQRDGCPRKSGPLSHGIVSGKNVTCPSHERNVALSTGEAVAPEQDCAGHVPVRVIEERKMLLLPAEQTKLASAS
ncbi:MAG: nitrite reductase (NAD(P)H) small subunit [Gammaproteobacteria bacterium]|nr:nitrite reductase (NAD(P)H) small subunit [Gammaproteobacteria bacterium]